MTGLKRKIDLYFFRKSQMISRKVAKNINRGVTRCPPEYEYKWQNIIKTMQFNSKITPEELNDLEYVGFAGEIYIIEDNGEEYSNAIKYLKNQTVLGFDTETRPCFSSGQPRYKVSLLQLSGGNRAYLFRVQLLEDLNELYDILADENILKIGAAVNDDIRGLQKHLKFSAKSFVDLQKIVWEWGIKDKSVKKMAAIILGYKISKGQQLSNWEADYLSDSQAQYAATDAWVCREMYIKLLNSEKNPIDFSVE